jgi:hypothetical protein
MTHLLLLFFKSLMVSYESETLYKKTLRSVEQNRTGNHEIIQDHSYALTWR